MNYIKFLKFKKGFTILEVIIAFSIFIIVILGLLGNYYGFYSFVRDLRYRTIGQNLAQLQLEDIQSLSVSVLDSLVKGGYYPDIVYDEPNYPLDKNNDDTIYDSGEIDGSFRIERILNILGTENSPDLPPIFIPPNIDIKSVLRCDIDSCYYDYTIILNKEIYPRYYKRILIEDKTPNTQTLENKIYEIKIIVYWELKDGNKKSLEIKGMKSYDRSYQD